MRGMLHLYNSNQIITTNTSSTVLSVSSQSSACIPTDGTHTVYKHTHL